MEEIRNLRRRRNESELTRQRLLSTWVRPGTRVFDLGANVGELTEVFVRLGGEVVAVEPHPRCVTELRRRFHRSKNVSIVAAAASDEIGTAELHLGSITEVSTLSTRFRTAYQDQPGGVHWSEVVQVRTTTLDALIGRFGMPGFAKLDLEGHEPDALEGLSRPIPALSIEYNARLREESLRCIERLDAIAAPGRYRWNFSPYESYVLSLDSWLTGEAMRAWLSSLSPDLETGDVYGEYLP